jgi:hypothetical protein
LKLIQIFDQEKSPSKKEVLDDEKLPLKVELLKSRQLRTISEEIISPSHVVLEHKGI